MTPRAWLAAARAPALLGPAISDIFAFRTLLRAPSLAQMRERTQRLHDELHRFHTDDDYATKAARILHRQHKRTNVLLLTYLTTALLLGAINHFTTTHDAATVAAFAIVTAATMLAATQGDGHARRQLAQIRRGVAA
ncbi:MAG: hypothetical protein ACLGIK_06440 [Gemmatimonadota bacterium]